jgi:hypothetical protein
MIYALTATYNDLFIDSIGIISALFSFFYLYTLAYLPALFCSCHNNIFPFNDLIQLRNCRLLCCAWIIKEGINTSYTSFAYLKNQTTNKNSNYSLLNLKILKQYAQYTFCNCYVLFSIITALHNHSLYNSKNIWIRSRYLVGRIVFH